MSKKNRFSAFFHQQDWGGFLLNFLAVVLGIVITFWGESLISNHKEQKEVRDALILVRDELKDNMASLDSAQVMADQDNRAALYLMQYYDNFEACNRDSMRLYCNLPVSINPVTTSANAMELLKSAGLFQKIPDKTLALDIMRAYNAVDAYKHSFEFYNDKKNRLIDAALQEEAKALFASPHFTAAEMWTALTSTVEGRQFLHEINITVSMGFGHDEYIGYLDQVIGQLDEFIEK